MCGGGPPCLPMRFTPVAFDHATKPGKNLSGQARWPAPKVLWVDRAARVSKRSRDNAA